ncbi:MAG TPA: phage/plasmid primase, P4 family, partial [Bacteroidia bacterium]|nr:phage/plasmid primase, P4 family [Bacteroidia bacterium]
MNEIQPINFRDYLELPEDEKVNQKHIVVSVVKHLLQIAKDKHWNLSKVYDYTYIYNGEFWQQCDKDVIKDFLGKAAMRMSCPERDALHYEFKDKLFKQFLSDAHLPPPPPEANKILINLQNGTFEFTTAGWKLREFNANDFITYQLPFTYNADAICPMFDKYLLQVLPDDESRKVLQEFAGYVFTKMNLEKCLILTGSGQNGKSVFFNIISALIGKENILTYSLGLFSHEYNRAKLTNVLLNYSSEKGTELNPDTFKALISGEPLQAREPYGKSFTLNNKVRFIINANELPKETEQTEAYFRRFLIVPFDVKINDADKDIHLADKIIKNELTGVFNWLLTGLDRIILQDKFTECSKADTALSNYRRDSDSVALFTHECNYISSPTNKEALTDLYNRYKIFCIDDGYKPCGKNKFSTRLEN